VEYIDPIRARLAELLPELMGLLHCSIAGETLAIMHEANLTMPQVVSLHVLRHLGPLGISELAGHLRLSTSAASSLVDRLVERELVHRAEDPEDRRQKRVALAPAGVALVADLTSARARELTAGLQYIDPVLRAEMAGVLEQVVTQLRSQPYPTRSSPS
jgi:DNA-binding MarR family transcriptional regulator